MPSSSVWLTSWIPGIFNPEYLLSCRCLAWYGYSIWFVHLPSYLSSDVHHADARLREAFTILQRMHELGLQPLDEVGRSFTVTFIYVIRFKGNFYGESSPPFQYLSFKQWCLKVTGVDNRNSSVLCCVWQLYTMIFTRMWAVVKFACWLRFRFCFFISLFVFFELAYIFVFNVLPDFVLLDLAKRVAVNSSPKWLSLCWVGRKTLTQSIMASLHQGCDVLL